jgi:hypothetical protein
MAPTGVTALGNTQIGLEATAGATTDAPTTHWRGMGVLKDRQEIVFPPERVGRLGGTTRSYIPRTGGEVTLDGDALFEQLPYIFNAGIYLTTATTDSGSSIVRTWTVPSASTDLISTTDLGTLVIENGDNNDAEIARFCFVREYTLAGKQGEAMTVAATLESRAPSTSTFTAVGATDFDNPAETILFSKVALYIDDSTGTIGTTQVTETILDFSLKHTTGWVPLPARDGRLDFSNIKRIDDEILVDMTWEHNTNASTEKGKWRSQTERAVRIEWTGSALSTTDTYSTKLLRLDMVGKWQTFAAEGLEEQDGDNVVKGTFRAASTTAGSAYSKAVWTIVNEVATLP